jgi:hypothetical protein
MPALSSISNVGVFTKQSADTINANFQALAAPLITQGNIYWVRPRTGNDQNDGLSSGAAFKTLAHALAVATANQNDVVLLCSESNTAASTTDYQSANLDWNKDGVHLIGVNNGSFLGQRSRIAPLSTATSFANLFTLSANNCLIQGIEFFQGVGSTNPSAASTCVTVSGQRNVIRNCQISGIGHANLDDAGSNSLTITGSENYFDSCYIGLDTIIRATSVTEVVLSGTPTRNIFEKCHFETYTSGSTFKMVTVPTGADRFVKFLDCDFVAVQNITSAAAPTGVIGITTMNGQVIMKNPYVYGFAQIVTADNAYVQVLGYDGLATGHLIGIAQGVDAA